MYCAYVYIKILWVWRRLFQEVWRDGVPVVVRCVRKGYQWDPATMGRATTEKNARYGKDSEIEARTFCCSPPFLDRVITPCLVHHPSICVWE